MKKKLPGFLQSVLWSYNLAELDLEKDKAAIIAQVLNYGDWKDLKWLCSIYSDKDIKKIVSHPGRGLWFEKVLNFWELMLNIRIPQRIRQKAIFNINPAFS